MHHPSSAASDRSVRFWDRIAERYARQPIADPDTYERKIRLTQTRLTPESHVLEFGCGTGSTALLHAPKVASILAIDSSQAMVDIATRKLADSELENVEFRRATLLDLGDECGPFDAVLGLNVLHLIADYRATIRRAYDLLEPGGFFITSTVCTSLLLNLMKPILRLGAALGRVPRFEFIRADELERAMTDCGFEIVERLLPKKATGARFVIAVRPR